VYPRIGSARKKDGLNEMTFHGEKFFLGWIVAKENVHSGKCGA
jgi:hypothetical protein